ncbi:MAG: nucleotidyltransferase domain-containing protein [Planctomycetes bacterium]|nr:nucleotidyltransferase domain-containing protein [Planctomycetota bacterium]
MGTVKGRSLSESLFGKARRAVLSLLYSHVDEAFYLRQIVRAACAGQGAIQREVGRLTEAGVISRSVRFKHVYYQANPECPIFQELKILMVKTAGAAETLRDALSDLSGRIIAAFIYGSMARGEEKARSDVDVMVIGKTTFGDVVKALRPAEEKIGREVNPTVYPPAEFKARLAARHHFLTSVLNEPKIFLIGDENDLAGLAEK